MPFALDLSGSAGHLAGSLHQQLRGAILDGRLAAGTQLPSSRRLAEELGISRNTVMGAYDLLVAEGYVLPRPGAKAVIADLHTRQAVARRPVSPLPVEDVRLAPMWRTPYLAREPARVLPERSFRLGMPDHRHFPHALWRKLTAQVLQQWSKQPFAYPPSEGIPALRAAIAKHVAFARAVACTGDDIIVTNGAQQAFDLLARLLVTPGETRVAVEEPGYPPLRGAFVAAGARLVPMRVDDEGLCVDELPDDVRVVSVTPSHQSPTGVALSLRRRMALLDFARRNGAVVIEDDYDGEFRFGGRPLDALQTLDREGVVFYVGTFTKSLFPAVRKGFIVAPAWAHDALAAVKHCADSHSDVVTQSVLATFIADGHMARHVRKMRAVYAPRREALLAGLRAMPAWFDVIPSEAGMHLAARVRDASQMGRVMAAVREHTPGAQSIAEYSIAPPAVPAVTFGYGVIDADAITASLASLRKALQRPA
ncbi:GntR family transcriptional regulator [Lysobacter helvus]|uniref:GntR family transcriptional regulator n=1 Tax=Lysobacter helvus TaxID=2675059 RepID=A0ABN6G2S3_9GAMM|nr:GntR family transcriptional regulator [Lysobacter helvus]